MTFKRIATACVAFSLVAAPAERAVADNALVGGIVGGIIGGVIVNEANKNRARKSTSSSSSSSKRKTYSSSGISSAQREQNREVQTALNYFGFPVGSPDGAIGPKSRAAIAEYQVTMGFPGTGQLNDFERDILVSSYYRAQSGGAATATLMATNPRGPKGVLVAWKDERLGIGTPQGTLASGTGLGAATFAAPVVAGAVAPAMPTFQAAPVVPALPAAATSALPSFMAQGAAAVSLASMCSQVSVVTSTNGGYMTQLNMTDPTLALSEQFCLARAYAIAQSDDMVSKVAGFTPQQIADQCTGFAPVLKDHVAAVSLQPRQAVVDGVLGFVTGSGMAPAQLAGTAKICLGIGYKVDNTELALGSALLLGVLGERAYGELVAHHLAQGIGATPRPDLALGWFEAALGDPSEPIVQIFAPQMPDRAGLIRMAAYAKAGQPMPGGSIPGAGLAPAASPAVPTFAATIPEAAPAPAAPVQPAAQPEAGGGFGFKIPFLSNP